MKLCKLEILLELYIFAIISKMEHFGEKCLGETMIALL